MSKNETVAVTLRACPFCPDGGKPRQMNDYSAGINRPYVVCWKCMSGSDVWQTRASTEKEAALEDEIHLLKIRNELLEDRCEDLDNNCFAARQERDEAQIQLTTKDAIIERLVGALKKHRKTFCDNHTCDGTHPWNEKFVQETDAALAFADEGRKS